MFRVFLSSAVSTESARVYWYQINKTCTRNSPALRCERLQEGRSCQPTSKPPDLLVDGGQASSHHLCSTFLSPKNNVFAVGLIQITEANAEAPPRPHASPIRVLNRSFETLLTVISKRPGRRPDGFTQTVETCVAR